MKQRQLPWVALQHRNFALLASGEFIGQIGTGMQQVVLLWQMYLLTDSALSVGLTGLMRAIPSIFFSLAGGVLADSIDRRRLLIVAQGVGITCACTLFLLTMSGVIAPWMIYVLAFVAGSATAFEFPARRALVPSLVPSIHVTNAVNLVLTLRRSGGILGPAIGGFVVAGIGIAPAYAINAASLGVVILALLSIRMGNVLTQSPRRFSPGMLGEGLRFVVATPVLRSVLLIAFSMFLFTNTRSSWPVFARDIFDAGPQGLGILGSAPAAGGVLGLITAVILGDLPRKGLVVAFCCLGCGISIAGFGLAPALPVAAAALVCFGFVDSVNDSLRHTLVSTLTPHDLQGRVNSVAVAAGSGGWSLGELWVGFLVTAMGAREAVVLCGTVVALGAFALFLFDRALVRYGAGRPAPELEQVTTDGDQPGTIQTQRPVV